MDIPTIGRIVHYQSFGTPNGEYSSTCRAAVVADVYQETTEVSLVVLNPTGMFFNQGVLHDEDKAGGTWHWPERV